MTIRYKSEILVSDFSRSGWDTYDEQYTETIVADSKEDLDELEKKFIAENTKKYNGDFGICLRSTSCSVVRRYKSIEDEF